MKRYFYENDRQKKGEAYLLAKGNPWLLWRLQVFRAGHTPPLLHGQIPRELVGIPLGPQEEYHVEDLIKHANQVRVRERHFLIKMLTTLMISMTLLIGLTMLVQYKLGSRFRIPLFESIYPRIEATQVQIK
jgi:hypothetical protein